MEHSILLSITPDDLRCIIADTVDHAVAQAFARHTPAPPGTISQPDDYLSRSDVRRMLRLSFQTLRNLERRGELIPVRIARRVLYRRCDVQAALQGGTHS